METATSPMQPKPLVNVTCKLGTKGCFADGKCHALGNCENKIITTGDSIRAMSDEELAEKIFQVYADNAESLSLMFCDGKAGCIDADGDIHCSDEQVKACIIRRLRQPADYAPAHTMDTSGKEESGLLEEE